MKNMDQDEEQFHVAQRFISLWNLLNVLEAYDKKGSIPKLRRKLNKQANEHLGKDVWTKLKKALISH